MFRNRKRTFQHQRLANTAGLFSPIPSQDSSPSTNHHNPLTSNSAKGASGRNRGISANGNSVASGRTGSGELVGWMERGNKMRGGLLKKGIALQGHICTVQRSKGGAVDGPCICFLVVPLPHRFDGFWRLIASHCASFVDLKPFCTGGPEATWDLWERGIARPAPG